MDVHCFERIPMPNINLKQVQSFFTKSCFIGFLLSVYAFIVEQKAMADAEYKAFCDIDEHMSCTKVFRSDYARGFGVVGRLLGEDSIFNQPNCLLGIGFYFLLAVIGRSCHEKMVLVQIALCFISNLLSIYLACILYFVLSDFCLVCVSTYVVNFVNLILAIWKFKLLARKEN